MPTIFDPLFVRPFIRKTFLCDTRLASRTPGVHSSSCTSSCEAGLFLLGFNQHCIVSLNVSKILEYHENIFKCFELVHIYRLRDGRWEGRRECNGHFLGMR